jgi:single-stranded-DNA-specific exonuclease
MWYLSQKIGNNELGRKTGLSGSIIHILGNRGYRTVDSILHFLRPSLFELHSPFLFQDMQNVIDRLRQAWDKQEKILVYGDYDADGVTGTALLYKALQRFGFQVLLHVPSREEGYGLHAEAIEKAHTQQVKLVITVDCGITAVAETLLAAELGIDLIITDHHEPPAALPPALGILNPKVAGCTYPFPHLAGVGVAFKLVQALYSSFGYPRDKGSERDYLDLAALGTIADIVPLTGENRIIVKYGLEIMEKTKHPGVKAILEECGLGGKKLKAGQISFIVAPRINAAGRMDTARLALNLFLENEYQEALAIARKLNQENTLRQNVERQIVAEAEQMLTGAAIPEVIVLSSRDWHHGVIGIVASRLVEHFQRPVFLICEEGETGKGSARGIPGYHVLQELEKQAPFLLKYGGHKQAAGFSLLVENVDALRRGLIDSFRQNAFALGEQLLIDSEVSCQALDVELSRELEEMAPFGAGNPAPVLMTTGLEIKKVMTLGKNGEHLKLILQKDDFKLEALAFKKSAELERLKTLKTIDIIYNLEINNYLGGEKIQAILKDYREGIPDGRAETAGAIDTYDIMEEAETQRERPLNLAGLERKTLVETYKAIRKAAGKNKRIFWLPETDRELQLEILKIFEELGFLRWLGGTGPFLLELIPKDKTDLQRSLRFRLLNA